MHHDPETPQFPTLEAPRTYRPRRRRVRCSCCLLWLLIAVGAVAVATAALILVPLGRTNVLVLGLDRRPEEGDAVRADAIMVVTADPQEPALGLLSIPRDLYLVIPGQGENRINTAHVFAELEEPGSGPGRTAAAITRNFGIPIHGWIRLDFQGLIAMVDAVGGVDVDVSEAIIDTAYPTEDYGTMTIEIRAGRQQMDGERALQFARSRHSGSDFDRAARQQQLVQALVAKLMRPATWPRLPSVWRAFDQSIDRQVGLLDLVRLGIAVLRVGPQNLERLVIDDDLVTSFTTEAGAAVLAPRWELIQPKVEALFN
jgi:LCP family protein required for cell wall assembly